MEDVPQRFEELGKVVTGLAKQRDATHFQMRL
jgi:hypothetical protein